MFDKTNVLSSLHNECFNILKNNVSSKLNISLIPNCKIEVYRDRLKINSIASGSEFYIVLLFPRLSNLRFASESYGSQKKHSYRLDLIVVSQSDELSYMLISKLHHFFDTNEAEFTKMGLKKPKIEKEFLKVNDKNYFSDGTLSGTFSAWGSNIYGEVYI